MSDMTITAAVDGSSLSNPGPSGWAWVVDEEQWDAGGWPEGTNNLGELTAILELLKATEAAGRAAEQLRILADSQYAINVITKWRHSWKKRGWTKADKKPIKNLELIQEIDRIIEGRDVCFEWVKGHAGHAMNEKADDLARGCAQAYKEGRVPAPGPRFRAHSASPASLPCEFSGVFSSDSPLAASSGASPSDSPALPEPSEILELSEDSSSSSLDIRELQKRFIQAWVRGEEDTLAELCAPDCVRVWPNGRITKGSAGLAGPVPPDPTVSPFELRDTGDAVVVTYMLKWKGGRAAEVSVWARDAETTSKRMRLVHHQSTPVAERD